MSAREALKLQHAAVRMFWAVLNVGASRWVSVPISRFGISMVLKRRSWDPAALVIAGPNKVRHLFVEGRQIVRDWHMRRLICQN